MMTPYELVHAEQPTASLVKAYALVRKTSCFDALPNAEKVVATMERWQDAPLASRFDTVTTLQPYMGKHI